MFFVDEVFAVGIRSRLGFPYLLLRQITNGWERKEKECHWIYLRRDPLMKRLSKMAEGGKEVPMSSSAVYKMRSKELIECRHCYLQGPGAFWGEG